MMFYSSNARKAAIESIHDLNKKIAAIPGSYLSYTDAGRLHKLLEVLEHEIEKEEKNLSRSEEA